MLTRLATHSDREKFQHVVISMTDEGVFGAHIRDAGIALHCLGMRRGRPSFSALVRLIQLLKLERPSIVQTWLYHADLVGLIALKLARLKAPIIWNLRCSDMPGGYHSRMTAWIIRCLSWLSRCPEAVIVNSQKGLKDHERYGYRPRRWQMIPNGFDCEHLRPDQVSRQRLRQTLPIPEHAIVFGLIARYDPMKNHDGFLRAASAIAEVYPAVHFLLAGEGVVDTAPAFSSYARLPSLKGRVHFLGRVANIPAVMTSLDVLVLSSAFGEGFPNVVGEAMSCGVPCIVSDVGDAAAIVGETGLIVPPSDVEALIRAMTKFVEMRASQRMALGDEARSRIVNHYAIEKIVAAYESLYKAAHQFRAG
jgi:glycosyltransferase involved in cell wall biosynthesis